MVCRLGSGWYMQSSVCVPPRRAGPCGSSCLCFSQAKHVYNCVPNKGPATVAAGRGKATGGGLGGQPMWLPQGAGCFSCSVGFRSQGWCGLCQQGHAATLSATACTKLSNSAGAGGWGAGS
jgi:hypothetical protein